MATEEKKGRGTWFWLLLSCSGCALVLCCIVSTISIMCVTSEKFKENITEGYCEGLTEQGISQSEDPFQLCD